MVAVAGAWALSLCQGGAACKARFYMSPARMATAAAGRRASHRRLLFWLDARGRDDLTPLPPLLLDHGLGLSQRAAGGEQLELAKAALHLGVLQGLVDRGIEFHHDLRRRPGRGADRIPGRRDQFWIAALD